MPSAREHASASYMAFAVASASCCGVTDISSSIRFSQTFEARCALLLERGDAFDVIRRRTELALKIAFEIELLVESPVRARADRFLDRDDRARRLLRELGGQLRGRLLQLGIVDDAPHDAPRLR